MTMTNNIPEWITKNKEALVAPRMPAWLSHVRETQWSAFLANGLPTRKNERWKYTDLSFLAVKSFSAPARNDDASLSAVINQHRLPSHESILLAFVDGFFMPQLSDLSQLPKGVIACNFEDALKQHSELMQKHWPEAMNADQPFASLNAACCMDGLFLYLPDNSQLEKPIHLLSIAANQHEFIAHPHHMLVLGKQSCLTILEEYVAASTAPYMMNIVMTIANGQDSQLELYKLQRENPQAIHMAHTFVHQKQNSSMSLTNISTGGFFARDEVMIKLQEAGANCRTNGFYRLRQEDQYIDQHIDITHAAPRSSSDMLYKGILDKKSRAVFNGRVKVEKDAQKVLAHQANHNLLLVKDAEVYSKPELEIYADDVKCKHGASTGQINQEALFYLRSRGVSYQDALHILLKGFADEVLQRVNNPAIRMRAQEMV